MPTRTSSTRASLSVWHLQGDLLVSRPVASPVVLTGDLLPVADQPTTSAQLIPVDADGGTVAAVLVPPGAEGIVFGGGVSLCCGLHLCGHTDQIDVDGQTFWVAASVSADVTTYDPAIHGDDAYCFVTKVRLQAGDEIVRCPGRPGVACGIIYRRAAWEMALDSDPKFRCPSCRFDPKEGAWKPSLPEGSSLQRLLEKARRTHGGRLET